MEDQASAQQQQNIKPDATTEIYDKNPKKVLVVLCIVAILIVGAILVFMSQKQKPKNANINLSLSTSPSQPPLASLTENEYVTKDTIIANSLNVPPFYSGATWEDVSNISAEGDINKVYIEHGDGSVTFPFTKGRAWKTTANAKESSGLERYYYEYFQKEGWFEEDGIGSLKFATFSLSLSADSPCGGVIGYTGYKDGMVRLVSIRRTLNPCNPPTNPNSPTTSAPQTTNYVLFVSDLLPIQEIAEYIKAQSGK